jgi:phage-related holin
MVSDEAFSVQVFCYYLELAWDVINQSMDVEITSKFSYNMYKIKYVAVILYIVVVCILHITKSGNLTCNLFITFYGRRMTCINEEK